MTPMGLAWRSLTRQPARAVLGIAGVVAVGALLFDMLLLSRGLVLSFEELLAHLPLQHGRLQCRSCGTQDTELHWRCPQCGEWDSFA